MLVHPSEARLPQHDLHSQRQVLRLSCRANCSLKVCVKKNCVCANTIRGCAWCVYVDCGMFDVVWKATRMTKPALFRVCGRIWPWLHCGDQPGNWPWVKIFISLMLLNETKKRTQIIWTQIPKASRVLQSYSGTLAKKRENVGILNKTSLILCFPQKGPKMIWSWKPCNIW